MHEQNTCGNYQINIRRFQNDFRPKYYQRLIETFKDAKQGWLPKVITRSMN